jgi:hypothetical protein
MTHQALLRRHSGAFESVMKAVENSGTQAAKFFSDCSHRCAYEAQRLRNHSGFVCSFRGDFVVGLGSVVINNVEIERQTLSGGLVGHGQALDLLGRGCDRAAAGAFGAKSLPTARR